MKTYPRITMPSTSPGWEREVYAYAALIGCEVRGESLLVPDAARERLLDNWWRVGEVPRKRLMKEAVERAVAKLSPAGQRLWANVKRQERFYRWEGPDSGPKTMRELEKAGLVGSMGRVVSLKRCWVPIGTEPFEVERFPSW